MSRSSLPSMLVYRRGIGSLRVVCEEGLEKGRCRMEEHGMRIEDREATNPLMAGMTDTGRVSL